MENELNTWFGKHSLPVKSKAQIKGRFNQLLGEFETGSNPTEVFYYRSSWGSLNNLKAILQLRYSKNNKQVQFYCNFSENSYKPDPNDLEARYHWEDCFVLVYSNGVHLLTEAGTRGYLKNEFATERKKARGSKILEDYFL